MKASQKVLEHIDQYARRWLSDHDFPGMALAITDREQLIFSAVHGLADLNAQSPVAPDTLFEIGSVGKPFTNIALLQLRDAGKFDLHAPVSHYLPWLELESQFPPITAHHLMSHTAGIIQGTDLGPHGLYEAWALGGTKPGGAPGEMCSYSNVGYKSLGIILEQLTGESFADAIQSRVLTPLGMTHSHPVVTFDTRKLAATGYAYFFDDRPEHRSHGLAPVAWSEFGTADGCQASTGADMARYLRLLLNRGGTPAGPLISEESFDLLTQRVIWTGNDYYGYGLATYLTDNGILLGHGGGTVGHMSGIIVDPDAGLGAVVMVNRAGQPEAPLQLARYALSVLRAERAPRELPPFPPVPEPKMVPDAGDYVGTYRELESDGSLHLTAAEDKLLLHHEGQAIILEKRGQDSFYVGHPDFALFLLEFKRQEGKVVEVLHGSRWWINSDYTGPRKFEHPQHWVAYAGHYRARNPQVSNFRVVLRKGTLVLIYPWGAVETLYPISNERFRLGEDERLPDTISFDAVVEDRALVADYCGCPYYRAFTP